MLSSSRFLCIIIQEFVKTHPLEVQDIVCKAQRLDYIATETKLPGPVSRIESVVGLVGTMMLDRISASYLVHSLEGNEANITYLRHQSGRFPSPKARK